MLISCPACATQFTVPDNALGAKGRTLKCARCGHKWFEPGSGAPEAEPAPVRAPEPEPEPDLPPEPSDAALLPGFEDFKFGADDFSRPTTSMPRRNDDDDLTEERTASLFIDEDERIPTALSPRAPRRTPEPEGRRRPAAAKVFVWTVLVGMVVAGTLFYATYLLQDEIARMFPFADRAMQSIGMRDRVAGEGLQIRNQRVERVIEGSREVLVIRGVIANIDDRPRDVPWVKAALLDDKNVVVMDRLGRPPVDGLDAGATTVFTIRIESPHPDAKSINLIFVPTPASKG
jgi:predicted Zn finger-like uncharacterized protein